MMLKLTIKDILRQKSFGGIAIVSGILLGIAYLISNNKKSINYTSVSIGITEEVENDIPNMSYNTICIDANERIIFPEVIFSDIPEDIAKN